MNFNTKLQAKNVKYELQSEQQLLAHNLFTYTHVILRVAVIYSCQILRSP
jgi:low temperature requirement protein LtrA